MKFLTNKILWSLIIILGLCAYFIPNMIATNKAKKEVDRVIKEYLTDYKVTYKKVSVNVYTKKAIVYDITLTPTFLPTKSNKPFIRINKIISKYNSWKDIFDNSEVKEIKDIHIPEKFYTKLEDVQINYLVILKENREKKEVKRIFNELGLENGTLRLDYTLQGAFDKKSGKLNYQTDIDAKKLLLFKSDFLLSNIETDENGKIKSEDSLKNIAFNKIKFQIIDKSLTNKIYKLIAEENKLDIQKVKELTIASLKKEIEPEKSEYLKTLFVSLKNFIEKPSTLIIELKPEKPIKFSEIFTILMFSKSNSKNMESFFKNVLGLRIEYK